MTFAHTNYPDTFWQGLLEGLKLLSEHPLPGSFPTHCEHDKLNVMADPSAFTDEELEMLAKMGFYPNEDNEYFVSSLYGSA